VASSEKLLCRSDGDLARVDPLETNLLVAKGIHALAHLDTAEYQDRADRWAGEVRRCLPGAEAQFHKTPQDWKHDLAFFRLGVLCWYVDEVLGIRYREDQKAFYTDTPGFFGAKGGKIKVYRYEPKWESFP
jgi:hypothetical protein